MAPRPVPVATRANAALGNERLVGFEGGFDFAPVKDLRFSLTAFDNRVRHAIANVTVATNQRERRNVGAVHARGIELGGSARLGTVSLDGTKVHANASRHRALSWEHAGKIEPPHADRLRRRQPAPARSGRGALCAPQSSFEGSPEIAFGLGCAREGQISARRATAPCDSCAEWGRPRGNRVCGLDV